MKVIQVGNGNVAKMHRQVFPQEVETIAVVDTNPQKREQAEKEGFPTFSDIDSMSSHLLRQVDFWDICVPDEWHLPVMKRLLERGAGRILVEKPICVPSQIETMEDLLSRFSGVQICVEESYLSSTVVESVKEQIEKYGLTRPTILMEQSKNRMQDIIGGRFIDKELGVFALEVPHSLTVVAGTGNKRWPATIQEVSLEDMTLPSSEVLPRQGKGKISYLTEDGCQVRILTAMNGEVLYPLPELNAPSSIPFGSPIRYRVLVLEEGQYKIIGQFEPIPDWPRFEARVLIYAEGKLIDTIKMEDRPMNRLIARAIRYFKGEEKNPAPPKEALSLVKFLREVMERLGP